MKKDELEALVKEQHEQIQELQQALVASAGRSMGGWVREVEERLGADYQRLAGELKRTQAELATMTARARTAESEQERDLAAQKKLADDYRKLKNEHKSCPTNAQLERAERERTRLKTQNEKLDLAAQKLRDAEQAWKTERARLLLDKTNLDRAFAEEKDRCASLLLEKAMSEAKHAQLETDRANLEAQCAQLSEDKKNLEQECARLKEEKALLSSNGSLALQNVEARAQQLTETNAALTRTNAAIAEDKRLAEAVAETLRTELARLRASHNQNCTDMRELADDLREMAAKDASWAAKTAGMQTRIDELEAERDEAVRARERLENRLDAQKDELARAKDRLDALRSVEKELRDCEEELASAKARIDALAPVEGRLQEALNQNAALAAQGQQLEQARHELEQTRRALAASQQNAAQQDPLHVQNLQNQLTYYMRISADARLSSTALATRVHGLEQTQAQYEERVQQYAAALNERSARVGVLEGQLAQVRGELQQAQAQLQQTQTQLQQTQAHLAQVQGQLAGAQAQLADTQGQLGQAQGAEKVVRSQDSQTNPVLVLRLSRQELEEREAAKVGLLHAQIEDDKALVRVAQTDLDSNKIAELTAERDELLDRLKGLDVVQTSMQEQLDAANRTTGVLRGEIARLNEIRYTTNASKTGDAPAAKPTLGPSSAANSVLDAGPSNPSVPAKSPSPGSKENILPQTSQSTSGAVPVAPEAVFGRLVLQCLRNLPWPAQGQMWLNMMVVLDPDSQVSLQTMRDLFVRDSGAMVGARDFGDMILALSTPLFPGKVLIADGVVTGIALREGVSQDGSQRPAAPVPVTPRGPPTVLPPPRSALPTPATAPRPPAPAGPRPLPPPRAAPPPPPPRTAPLPPPRTAHSPPPRVAPPLSPRAVPPSSVSRAALTSSPSVKTEPEAKRRAEEGDVSERPVKRSRFGYASSSSPAPPSSPAAVASSPTDRIASSNRFAPQNSSQRAAATPLINRTAPSGRFGPLNPLPRGASAAAAPATKTGSSTQSGTVKPATPTSAASPKPTSTPAQPRTAPSSPGKVVPPSSFSQPAARARAAPATQVQSPPPLHPEHRRQAVWDIDKSDVEDLFVLWLRQGALRDISSHVTRGVAVQRAADALRRLGWASPDGSNFVVSATSREYRHARFGKLTIAKALGFIDF